MGSSYALCDARQTKRKLPVGSLALEGGMAPGTIHSLTLKLLGIAGN